jgi:hypothetical protein
MDVDVGGVLRLHLLRRAVQSRLGIAILDEELPGIVERLQALRFGEQRLARQLGVRTAVAGCLSMPGSSHP